MIIRLDMHRAARRAGKLLNDSASLVRFVQSRQQDDGGYRGRGQGSDLYYTVFAMASLIALEKELPGDRIESYLQRFEGGASLDLVHLACLARCWADLPDSNPSPKVGEEILHHIEACRLESGGYSTRSGDETGTIYNGFLALGAYQDLNGSLPEAEALAEWVKPRREDPTPLLAGAAILLKGLGSDAAYPIEEWLLDRHDEGGGFQAVPSMPVADLLSTATALHALSKLGASLDRVKQPCLEFLGRLRSSEGGFHGLQGDRAVDCEYTYYGVLALGSLAT
jgi:hypothetical protein